MERLGRNAIEPEPFVTRKPAGLLAVVVLAVGLAVVGGGVGALSPPEMGPLLDRSPNLRTAYDRLKGVAEVRSDVS